MLRRATLLCTLPPMFVRWQRRKQGKGERWVAVLVESERVDGTPRQRHVAFLGSILDRHIQYPKRRQHFWEGVRSKMETLPNLQMRDRRAIERRIAEKIPVPTKREIAAADRDFAKAIQRITKAFRPRRA
jgi:hypothetical protein